MHFEVWMSEVDAILVGSIGLSSSDLPDQAYRDLYDAGLTPQQTVDDILENEFEL